MSAFRDRLRRHALHITLAILAYVPLIVTAPGKVPGDTKLYLYLDPWRLMTDALFSWDSRQFGGWVPHQNVGYLWPSGPWFGLFDLLRVPDWVAHRLWIGTLLFIAGAGVVHLGRRLRLPPATIAVAAFIYQLSPFILPYVSRTSALLLPWALLGWLVAITIRFTHERRPRDLAVFALLIFSSGGLNVTALLMIAPAPIAIIIDAVWRRRITPRRALSTTIILGATSLIMSAWWLAGLTVQGRYGSAVLSYTEALPSTSATSTAPEVLRGLGYWLFYDRNSVVPLTSASHPYQTNLLVILAGILIVLTGMWGLGRMRSTARRPLALMFVAGLVLAVGAFPYSSPTPIWRLLVDHPQSALSLSLRSSTRAVPLLLLAMAFGCGTTVESIRSSWAASGEYRRRWSRVLVPASLVIALVNLPALFTGRMVDPVMERPESLPSAWTAAADLLDRRFDEGHTGSVLILPGIESAAFRWGYPVDPILPGLTKKPMLNRDWVPQGSAPYMDVLYALDDSLQNGTASPESIAPIARLLGADTVMVVNSYQYERFGLDPPERAADLIDSAPGLEQVAEFGVPAINRPEGVSRDDAEELPEIILYEVEDATSGFRITSAPVITSGDGTSLVDLAAIGAIDGRSTVLASAALDDDELERALAVTPELLVTDGNRKRAHHWRGSQNVWGATERANVASTEDEFDHRLPVFPLARTRSDTQSIIDDSFGLSASASAYGALLAYYPEFRPAMAIDGDPTTAWLVGWGNDPIGQSLRLRSVARPLESLDLVPATHPLGVRAITRFSISIDEGPWITEQATAGVQHIELPAPAEDVRIRIDAVADGEAVIPAGWAEVIASTDAVTEYVMTPTDAVSMAPVSTPVSYEFSRLRSDPNDPNRQDPERAIHRTFQVSHGDGFVLTATATIADASLAAVDQECRTDLVTLDFSPIAVRIESHDGHKATLRACDPVILDRGQRILSTSSDSDVTIDRILLRSSASNAATPSTVVPPNIERTSRRVDLPACPAASCWIESTDGWNLGWSARIDGIEAERSLASAAGRGTWEYSSANPTRFVSTWTPQRIMWLGIGVSILGLIGCLILLLPTEQLRRKVLGSATSSVQTTSVLQPKSTTPMTPSPLLETVLLGTSVALLVHPIAGVGVALVSKLLRSRPRVVEVACLGMVCAGYAYVVVQQWRYSTPAGFGWPGTYAKVHGLVVLAAVIHALRCALHSSDDTDSISDL